MTEIEKIDFVFNYLNKERKINNLEMVFLHEAPVPLQRSERHKLYNTIVHTGFVNVLDHSVGPDKAIEMNGAGYKMMEEYGSYSAYCEAIQQEENAEKEDAKNEKKIEKRFQVWGLILIALGIIVPIILWLLSRCL